MDSPNPTSFRPVQVSIQIEVGTSSPELLTGHVRRTICLRFYHREGSNRVANVFCSRCNNILGIKFMQVQNNDHRWVAAGSFGYNQAPFLGWKLVVSDCARIIQPVWNTQCNTQ
ncbi:uncharacterized protein LOC132283767 [Cornus florida]|uniref:uncharacterized protein LOC132283767 n=1 Tax=Cornus florida TaxID=4283 RepID=UPI002897EF30|nr:uncharacterized protein LOC132283767 [Cornus florida]